MTEQWVAVSANPKSLAHAVRPGGGDDTWRTLCGRVVTSAQTLPAPDDRARCRACAGQAAGTWNPQHVVRVPGPTRPP